MCGIAGFSGNFPPQLLPSMSGAVAHRGPDGAGEITLAGPTGRVGLAHRRLSIIDLSADGAQPMTVECEQCGLRHTPGQEAAGLWLTYNGEIYNFAELRRMLEGRGHTFRSRTDSEVLLHLYADEGTQMLERLNGIFAFALYDGRPRGQRGQVRPGDTLVVRDGMGIKPLYYAKLPEGVIFGSEMKSLLQHRGVPRDLNPVAIHHHLAYLWAPTPGTVLSAVQKLQPGGAMLLRGGDVAHEWSFYDLPYTGRRRTESAEVLADEMRERLLAAVERQMVSDVPVGAFLSGGLDSSAVVAMMRRVRPDYVPRCYSIGFASDEDTEGFPADLPYARRVAAHLGVELEVLTIGPEVIGELDRVLYHLDEPQADPAPINALLIAERAREQGIKVLLSGAGGDDLFGGYRRHYALSMERYWAWLPGGARRFMAAPARAAGRGGAVPGLMRNPLARRAAKAFGYAHLDTDERMASYFWWSGEEVRRGLYAPEMAAALAEVSTAAPLLASLARIPNEHDPLQRMLYLEAKHFLADHNLNYTDKMGMAAGVEVRVPLLDPDLAAFAVGVPSAFKQRGRVGKWLFKKSMEPFLPHDVIYRPKAGFGAPLRRWMQVELRDRVDEVLSERSLRSRGLFDPAAVHRLLEQDRAGRVDASYTLFALYCLETWCRTFVDSPVPEPPARGGEARPGAALLPAGSA